MKQILIVLFIILNITAHSQASKSTFKTIGISFQNYAKPQTAYGITPYAIWSSPLERENSFNNAKNNLGISAYYSQSNFLNNFGIEYGIGIDFISINNTYNLSLVDSNYNWRSFDLSEIRTPVWTISAPVFYVHKFKLTDKLTLFPKIGVITKLFAYGGNVNLGKHSDIDTATLNYKVNYTTYNDIFNISDGLTNFLFTGAIGASLSWKLNNGNMLGLDLMINKQLFRNSILSEINNITYKKKDEILYDSENSWPDHYIDNDGNVVVTNPSLGSHYAKHSLSSISIGISYKFMKH